MFEMVFWLIAGHAIADFALQSEWLTQAKNHNSAAGAGVDGEPIWPIALGAHGAIHGAAVALATGSVLLGALETISHVAIDYFKSDGRFGLYADQALHLGFKVLWLVLAQEMLAGQV